MTNNSSCQFTDRAKYQCKESAEYFIKPKYNLSIGKQFCLIHCSQIEESLISLGLYDKYIVGQKGDNE